MDQLTDSRTWDFTMISKKAMNDKRLSFAAKGIYAFLSTKPDGYEFTDAYILTLRPSERESDILEALAQLRRYEYIGGDE